MLLTTAAAWGVASEADVVDAMAKKAGIALMHRSGSAAGDGRLDAPPLKLR